jgi:hypothetical protein
MTFDGELRDDQEVSDFGLGSARDDEGEDFSLAGCQCVVRRWR